MIADETVVACSDDAAPTTVSIGIADLTAAEGAKALFAAADRARQVAKETGRDRVVVARRRTVRRQAV